jgi:hypothetical protein
MTPHGIPTAEHKQHPYAHTYNTVRTISKTALEKRMYGINTSHHNKTPRGIKTGKLASFTHTHHSATLQQV